MFWMSERWRFKGLLSLVSFLMLLARASAVEGFSSFSFNGFNGFNSAVDNEGYYKVQQSCRFHRSSILGPRRSR